MDEKEIRDGLLAELERLHDKAGAGIPDSMLFKPTLEGRSRTWERNKAALGTVTVSVPGSPVFEILNSRTAIAHVIKKMKKDYPVKPWQGSQPVPKKLAVNKRKPSFKPVTDPLAFMRKYEVEYSGIRKDDPKYKSTLYPSQGECFVCDGRSLLCLLTDKPEGSPQLLSWKKHRDLVEGYTEGGIPCPGGDHFRTASDVPDALTSIRQAEAFWKGSGHFPVVSLYSSGGRLELSCRHPDLGSYGTEEGELIGYASLDVFSKVVGFLSETGCEAFTLMHRDSVSPFILTGETAYGIVMPVRMM